MKILITPRSFAMYDDEPIKMLEEAGYTIELNKEGKILDEALIIEKIKDVDAIIVGVDSLTENVLKYAKNLKIISKYGVGTDNIDLSYCKENNIKVTITENANAEAVADYTLALMSAVARRVVEIDDDCRHDNWQKKVSIGLHDKTVGVVGLGHIAKGVLKRCHGYNMRLLAYDVVEDESLSKQYGVTYVTLTTLLKESDFISLHLPLTDYTENIINKENLSLMKESAILINTARGGLVDEEALYHALVTNKIYGAGLDVFKEEPPKDKRFYELKQVVLGNHCAASTKEAVHMMSFLAVENVIDYLEEENVKNEALSTTL